MYYSIPRLAQTEPGSLMSVDATEFRGLAEKDGSHVITRRWNVHSAECSHRDGARL